jgi:hypothetical protein
MDRITSTQPILILFYHLLDLTIDEKTLQSPEPVKNKLYRLKSFVYIPHDNINVINQF